MRFLTLFLTLITTHAFTGHYDARNGGRTSLSMAPKYDKALSRWVVTDDEDGPEAGYGPVKTLLLRGPKPFFSRIFTPDDYEQAVLKFMAGEKCSREVAQGNMVCFSHGEVLVWKATLNLTPAPFDAHFQDRYLENGQDWAFERLEAEKKGRDYPAYHILDTKQLVLTLTWSAIVSWVLFRIAIKYFIV